MENEDAETPVRTTPGRRLAQEWALALTAEGMTPTLRRVTVGYAICVPPEQAERADAALAQYLIENQPTPEPAPAPVWAGDAPVIAALIVFGALLGFFLVTGPWASDAEWFVQGAARADRMSAEPWRAITALTLHTGSTHALANALAGTLFLSVVFRALGPGAGGALVLLAGALGNFANALLHGGDHVSVGASTAVFAAVGILAGLGIVHRQLRRPGRRQAWMPIAASLALLAMLGTSGERTDLWAHALGLLAGGALALPVAGRMRRLPGVALQWACGGLALAAVLGAWALALPGEG